MKRKMKRKPAILSLASVCLIASSVAAPAAYAKTDDIQLRPAIENMEGQVKWNEAERSVAIQAGSVQAKVIIDSADAEVQGKKSSLDKKPYIQDGSTFVSPATFKQIQTQLLQAQNKSGFELAATFSMPGKNAEIVSSTPDGKTLLVTEASLGSISIVSIDDLNNIQALKQVSFKSVSGQAEVTSVAVMPNGKHALVAVRKGDDVDHANKGALAVVDIAAGTIVKTYEVGIGPDAVTFSKDGTAAVVCIEDEELDPALDEIDFSRVKRPGSIAVFSFPNGDALNGTMTDIPLDLTNAGPDVTYPNDPQPEYAAISPDGTTAAVTLQENNAIALVDLKDKKVTKVFDLGTTKHKADLKNDGIIAFKDDLTARPEADGIVWSADGRYLYTANEGDLGKDEFKDGVKSGGRNIMAWDLNGSVVYDSMELIDRSNAKVGLYPDDRSPNRGSEVENLTLGEVDGKQILAVCSERASTILFFDVTDAAKPSYLGLVPAGGTAPEGIHKVNGRDLFVSAEEETGTLSFYQYTKK
ncbi:YncE family protein [Paenibacillus sp. H1-7]|uniref:choice-of-anchor I domain-containing protein n=1 Tax=Paenibacillus sp. H1-7 TaxID=2282849 RepID=UPI001EF78778|nr:stalk domain-containing protein [Paenibacillus sp. H1-7]ULL13966.1 YncE family protein [Paenibacillus sp. H1-7]